MSVMKTKKSQEDHEEIKNFVILKYSYSEMFAFAHVEHIVHGFFKFIWDSEFEKLSPVVQEMFTPNGFVEAFIDWVDRFKCLQTGCNSLREASPSTLLQSERCSGIQELTWKNGGYSNLIDILMKNHSGDTKQQGINNKILLKKEVCEIKWTGHQVLVRCTTGDVIPCDHVIVTVSLGVLKDRTKLMFKPPLPFLHTNAIQSLGIGTVNKIYLKYESQWWPDDCSGFSFIDRKKDVLPLAEGENDWEREIVGFFTENGSPMVLCAWIVGIAAVHMEQCSEDDVAQACTRILKKFLSNQFAVPEPQSIIRSQWFSNPHFRGSYSFRTIDADKFATGSSVLGLPVINWDKPLIHFAGEATSEHFFSTAHGALQSGWNTADKIINFYRTSTGES